MRGISRGLGSPALYLRRMSVQRNGVAAPVVAKLPSRDGAAPTPALVQPSRDGQLLPDALVDELADKLSRRLVDRLVDPLVGSAVDLAGRGRQHRDDAPCIQTKPSTRRPSSSPRATSCPCSGWSHVQQSSAPRRSATAPTRSSGTTSRPRMRTWTRDAAALRHGFEAPLGVSRSRKSKPTTGRGDRCWTSSRSAVRPAPRQLRAARPPPVPGLRDRGGRSAGRPRASFSLTCDRLAPLPSADCGPPTPSTSLQCA
jgi:hypothetical protein